MIYVTFQWECGNTWTDCLRKNWREIFCALSCTLGKPVALHKPVSSLSQAVTLQDWALDFHFVCLLLAHLHWASVMVGSVLVRRTRATIHLYLVIPLNY